MNNNPLTSTQKNVLDILQKTTKKNQITGRDITNRLKLIDDKKTPGASLRLIINCLRTKGYPICGSKSGYYIAENPADLRDYIELLKSRISKQQEALDGLEEGYIVFINVHKSSDSVSINQRGLGI